MNIIGTHSHEFQPADNAQKSKANQYLLINSFEIHFGNQLITIGNLIHKIILFKITVRRRKCGALLCVCSNRNNKVLSLWFLSHAHRERIESETMLKRNKTNTVQHVTQLLTATHAKPGFDVRCLLSIEMRLRIQWLFHWINQRRNKEWTRRNWMLVSGFSFRKFESCHLFAASDNRFSI